MLILFDLFKKLEDHIHLLRMINFILINYQNILGEANKLGSIIDIDIIKTDVINVVNKIYNFFFTN